MEVIASWTAADATALQQSLRMSNQSFAGRLGVAVRTVAYWRQRPEIVPALALQSVLDELLERAPDRAKAQFAQLVGKIGTVARVLPRSRSLTVVELDARLIGFLRENVPHAKVLHGDALEIIRDASFDVLIGNLPHVVTESLLEVLPRLSFRTAVMSVSESSDLGQLGPAFSWSESRGPLGTTSRLPSRASRASSKWCLPVSQAQASNALAHGQRAGTSACPGSSAADPLTCRLIKGLALELHCGCIVVALARVAMPAGCTAGRIEVAL